MAMTEAHCCRLLGLSAAATLEETRVAYRRIARTMHPDRAGGDPERFKEITAAYNWLVARRSGRIVDPPRAATRTTRPAQPTAERRARARRAWEQAKAREAEQAREAAERARAEAEAAAERVREEAARAKAARQRARAAKRKAREAERATAETRWDEEFTDAWEAWCRTAERYHARQEQHSADAAAERSRAEKPEAPEAPEAKPWVPPTAEAPADKGASIFGRVRQGLRRMARKAALDRVGQDVSLRLPIDLDLLMHGGTRTLGITRAGACPSCAGAGDETCVCSGTGRIKLREAVKVTVPPGARSGAKLRLEGKGTAGLDGAPDGDLFLLLEPEVIPGFRSEGLDLHGHVTLSRRLADDGGTVAVELPRGRVKLKVPRGSRGGDTFRLRAQGLPSWGGAERGDLFLSVVIR